MRILFALPGLHRYDRGAETAFISIAQELARAGHAVSLIGSGAQRAFTTYQFVHASSLRREYFEKFPSLPMLRGENAYEELTFVPGLLLTYDPAGFDVTLTCSYPFTNWMLRRPMFGGQRPAHIFVTQNGDWPAHENKSEYRFFGCDGLICTNPDFYERNKDRWRCRVIPNGVDVEKFKLGVSTRQEFGIPDGCFVVLMVSALIPTKRVGLGIDAVSQIPNAHLVVAGDGPLRKVLDVQAERLMPGRFTRLTISPDRMPQLYQSADVFLHLSKEETFGNVFVEAMACGLPVVGHETSRSRWIVGEEGCLTNTDDIARLVQEIKFARCASFAKKMKMVDQAAKFSLANTGKLYETFLKEVIECRRAC